MMRIFFILLALLPALRALCSDTIRPVSFSDTCALAGNLPDLVTYKTQLGGYICGNNALNTPEKAQKYYWADSAKMLTAVAFWFGQKMQAPFPGLVRAKAYAVNAGTGAPGALLGESNLLSVGNIDTSDNLTVLSFANPVSLPDTFFVALDLSLLNVGDSVGLLSTRDACFSGEQLAWEKDSLGAWIPMNDGTSITSWGLDIDMAIFPVGDFGLHTGIPGSGMNVPVVYPNPASDKIKVNWAQEEVGPVTLHFFDMQGRMVCERKLTERSGMEMDVRAFIPGMYFLIARALHHTVAQKVLILR